MMRQILKLVDRARKIDIEKLTPAQIGVGILGIIVAIWIVIQVINLALALAPILIAGIALFFIVQWLSSQDEEIPEELTKSRAQRTVEAAMQRVFGSGEAKEEAEGDGDSVTIRTEDEDEEDAEVQAAQQAVSARNAEATAEAEEAYQPSADLPQPESVEQVDDERLVVKQVVNPETGFKEPDISRLIEREQEKLKEADKVTEDIMAQIEARRKRLLSDDGES